MSLNFTDIIYLGKAVPGSGGGGGGGSGLPDQTGHSGEFLTTDGTDASWSNTVKEIEVKNASSNFYKLKLSSSSTSTSGLYYSENNYDTAHFVYNSNYKRWYLKGGTNSNDFVFDELNTCLRTNSTGGSLGNSSVKWDSIYVTKINNGADITVPNQAGTMAVIQVNTTITLTAAGWSSNTQTVTVNGVTSTSVVFVAPDPTDTTDYVSAGILCTAQETNSLTFTATTTPSADIDVVVVAM